MITDEERRDVAENLRNLTIGHFIQYKEQFFDELAEVVVGFEDYHDFNVVLEKLADLIDRPTCEYVPIGDGRFGCSECGNTVRLDFDVPVTDETPMPFKHCPNCGAEVRR